MPLDDSSTAEVTILVLLCWTTSAEVASAANPHVHTPSSCTEQTVRMRPDNYMRCLMHFGKCVNDAGPYDYDYYDALRRNVADSCREFTNHPDVLPATRRLVYDTSNLYLRRIGQTVYRHEMAREAQTPTVQATSAATNIFPPAHRFVVVATTAVTVLYLLTDVGRKMFTNF